MPQTFNRADRISAELRSLVGTLVHEVVREHALPSLSVSDVEAHPRAWRTANGIRHRA